MEDILTDRFFCDKKEYLSLDKKLSYKHSYCVECRKKTQYEYYLLKKHSYCVECRKKTQYEYYLLKKDEIKECSCGLTIHQKNNRYLDYLAALEKIKYYL